MSALLMHGARVTLLGRNAEVLAKTVQEHKASGELDYVTADITSSASVATAFARAVERFWSHRHFSQQCRASELRTIRKKTDEALWQQMLSVNLTGTFHCTQAALPAMLEAGWGRIVNVVSTAGLTGYSYVAAYCAAKHGVIGLTRALALELATKGITVNAVCPGYTETDIVSQAVANIVAKTQRSEDQARAELAARNPQKKTGATR
ncbi:SDR family NAD(P)-dependent oxidoreductase [Undibacterium arcticum]